MSEDCNTRCSDAYCRMYGCQQTAKCLPLSVSYYPPAGNPPALDPQAIVLNRIAEAIEKLAEAISRPTNTPEK